MAQTTPKNSGYTIINGSTTGKNGSKVNTWLEYKVTQNIANNTSTIDVYLYARANTSGLSTSWDGARSYGSITFDGTSHAGASISGYDFRNTSIYNEFAHYSQTVTHDSTGKKTITLAGAWDKGASTSTYITGGSVPSTSVTLPTIPRYATVSQSLGGKTETGITVKWSSDSTIDYVWYSKNNGTSWTAVGSVNATSGSYTISGLTANTSYTIKTRVRRKDSQLTTDSSAMTQTTYNYPYATNCPNFTIGNTVNITLYNPLARSVKMYITANGQDITDVWVTTTGTSISWNSGGWATQLYATIPNTKSASYSIKIVYGSSTITKSGGTMSANASACTPTIGGLTYQDTKTATVNITGNNQQIIRNQSTVRYTASSLSAKNSATISSVKVVVNGSTYNLTVSGTSATGGNAVINSGTNVTATATITDSRGFTATKTVTVQMLDWVLPTATLTLQRQNNFYSNTTIKADAYYSSLGGKNSVTITYKAKPTSASSWTYTGSLSDNVGITLDMDNEQDWNVQIVITDRLGSTTYNAIVNRGTPIIYFDRVKNSVGIEGFPNDNRQLKVEGIIEGQIRKFKSRQTTADLTEDGLGGMSYFLATQTMTEGKPPITDGHIIHMGWDNANGLDSQLAVVHSSQPQVYVRSQVSGVWGDWMAVGDAFMGNLTSGDFNDLTARGTYFINTNSGMTNAPYGDYGYLIVRHFNVGTTIERTVQTFTRLYGQGIYQRTYANGEWRPWYCLYAYGDYSTTAEGLTINVRRRGTFCRVSVSGTPTSTVATSGAYYNLATLPELYRPSLSPVDFAIFNATTCGQFNITNAGVIRLGYTRDFSGNNKSLSGPIYLTKSYECSD